MSTRLALNDFFVSVQMKALRQAEFAVKNKDEALDIVQDAMERLAKHYSQRPDDWGALFQRILQNAIRDWYRKQKVRRLMFWSNAKADEGDHAAELDQVAQQELPVQSKGASLFSDPEHSAVTAGEYGKAVKAIEQLPLRQQQAFILRAWWGNNVAETAYAMNCSEGSVKTHYSRAVARLKQDLESEL